MYIKVINPAVHGKTSYSNAGSCSALVNYLNKENEVLPLLERELFFNEERKNITSHEVLKAIDNNHKGLRKSSPKFHSLVIAPSEEELKHINSNAELMKGYVCDVMNEYAKNFKQANGELLTSDDLVWFGKLEYLRGGKDNGYNMHVHVLVSARDKKQSITLNPNTNRKDRFNRVQFYLKSERAFDKRFNYKRERSILEVHQTRKHGVLADRVALFKEEQLAREQGVSIFDIIGSIDYSPEEGNSRRRKKGVRR